MKNLITVALLLLFHLTVFGQGNPAPFAPGDTSAKIAQRSTLMVETNGNTIRSINNHPLKQAPNWERNVDDMWQTQTMANVIPVVTTNYAAVGVSTMASAKTFYATNNTTLPWFVFWGNIPTNYAASSASIKGALPISSSGGSFLLRTRTAEITNEYQFTTVGANGQCGVEIYINSHPFGGSLGQFALKANTNCNIKMIFPSYQAKEISFAVSGYGGAVPGFYGAFCQQGGCFFQPQFRDDGCHYVTADSGIMGYGNGGDVGVSNAAGGFLGGLMLMTGQEWIYDGSGGCGYQSGSTRYIERMTNSVPLLLARGKVIRDIWAMGGGSDSPSNSAAIVAAVTNFYTTASNSWPTIERYCHAPWDAASGGSYPNAVTSIVAGCNLVGVPVVNINANIDTSMLTNPLYVWTSGPFVGHPTSNGHNLLEDMFLRYMMTQTNGYRSLDR